MLRDHQILEAPSWRETGGCSGTSGDTGALADLVAEHALEQVVAVAVQRQAADGRLVKPVMQLNTVVLPAPLGPMMAVIWRGRPMKETSSIATKPPKRMVRCSTSIRGRVHPLPPEAIGFNRSTARDGQSGRAAGTP